MKKKQYNLYHETFSWDLVTIKTPTHERDKPIRSERENCSFRITNAIKAETGGTKKNKVDV